MASEHNDVTLFREFLRIRTDHPAPEYYKAIDWLKNVVTKIEGLTNSYTTFTHKDHPIFVATFQGQDPSLPSVLLNAHTDVVPAERDKWNYDPFAAEKDAAGNIYARGTQDMKSVAVQFLLAMRNLKQSGVALKRTVHISYVPDEEIGGEYGMAWFVNSQQFKDLNVGVCLDEGLASPSEKFTVFYGERAPAWIQIKATGNTGHGSRFIENTATEKLLGTVNDMLSYRKEMFEKLQAHHECGTRLGDVVSLNLTMLKAGVTTDHQTYNLNVVPSVAEAGFDIRIPPNEDENVQNLLKGWVTDRGLELNVTNQKTRVPNKVTSITNDNIYWATFSESLAKQKLECETQLFPASTDSRFIRALNIPAFGFSPIHNTPILLHDHNEFLNEEIFLRGIGIFETLIADMANI